MCIMDAICDKLFKFSREPFIHLLIYDASGHKLLMRPILLLSFTLFGVLIARYLRQFNRIEVEYRYLFNSITDAILVTSFTQRADKEKFIKINQVSVKLLGYSEEELLNLSPADITDPTKLNEIPWITQKLWEDKHLVFETILVTKEGHKFPVEVNANIIEFREKRAVLALVRDVSARKRREAKIRRLASFPQLSPHPVLEVDASGDITFCNKACYDIVTHLGEAPAAFLPKDLESILQVAVEKDETTFHREVEVKGLLFSEMLYFAKEYGALRVFPIDVTERRKVEICLGESERQLRILATRLLEVQEVERSRITKELHDELGQSLLLLKLKLSGILDQMPKNQKSLRQQGAQLVASVDSLIDNIGRLIMDLSPKIVEELGLTSAIKVLLEEFAQQYNIGFDLVNTEDIDDLFPSPVQLVIYRIIQESLTNIGKHAKAARISCTIKKLEDQVWFSIKDDGRGFERKDQQSRGNVDGGIGLSIMMERARLAGGQLEIKSQVGAGTEITFSIPYQLEGKNKSGSLSNSSGR